MGKTYRVAIRSVDAAAEMLGDVLTRMHKHDVLTSGSDYELGYFDAITDTVLCLAGITPNPKALVYWEGDVFNNVRKLSEKGITTNKRYNELIKTLKWLKVHVGNDSIDAAIAKLDVERAA